jgi:cell division topological specificity factor
MRLVDFFKRPRSTAPLARERLQILLAHERAVAGKSDLIAILREEILAVIAKHFPVDHDGIKVKMERGEAISTLEVEVDIPTPMCPSFPLPPQASATDPVPEPACGAAEAAETAEAVKAVEAAEAGG